MLGASALVPLGLADDQHDLGFVVVALLVILLTSQHCLISCMSGVSTSVLFSAFVKTVFSLVKLWALLMSENMI